MGETSVDGDKPTESPVGNTVSKSEKKSEGNSFFSWLLVLALLGAWLSVGIVWFDLVDYNSVVGALGGVYDADGDGDFDVQDARVLLENRTVATKEKALRKHVAPQEKSIQAHSKITRKDSVWRSRTLLSCSACLVCLIARRKLRKD